MRSKVLLICLIGVLGTLMFLLVTLPWGIGIQTDTLSYIDEAKYFSTGRTNTVYGLPVSMLLVHNGPFYPFCLSIMDRGGIDLFTGMRWLNAVLFGLNIVLVGLILNKYVKVFWLALTGTVIMLISSDFFKVSVLALTDPLYIFFGLLSLLFFFDYMVQPRWISLVPAALAVSLATMTRYTGISLIGACIASIFLSKHALVGKFRHAALFLLISLFPLCVWSYINGRPMDRPFIFHLSVNPDYFSDAASMFCGWLLPDRIPHILKEAVLITGMVGFIFLGIFLLRKRPWVSVPINYTLFLVLFICFYISFLLVTVLFFDAYVGPSEPRHFMPAYIAGIILCFGLISLRPLSSVKADVVKIVLVYLLALYSIKEANLLRYIYAQGDGFTSKRWRQSETLAQVKSLPLTVPVYTNIATPVYIFRGGKVLEIPRPIVPIINKVNGRYLQDLEQMKNVLKKSNGVLVYFKDFRKDIFIESPQKLGLRMPLQLIATYSDGQIYKIK